MPLARSIIKPGRLAQSGPHLGSWKAVIFASPAKGRLPYYAHFGLECVPLQRQHYAYSSHGPTRSVPLMSVLIDTIGGAATVAFRRVGFRDLIPF